MEFNNTATFYIKEAKKYPLLTHEQEIELGKRIEAGDESAKEELYLHNIRLVIAIAKQFNHYKLDIEDVIQEGFVGLMTAVNKYDYRLNRKFSTYASWWIKQAISRASASQYRLIRLPEYYYRENGRIRKIERELSNRLGRSPKETELADACGLTVEELREIKINTLELTSLNIQVNEGDPYSQEETADFIMDEHTDVEKEATMPMINTELRKILKTLKGKNTYDVMVKRYGLDGNEPMTLEEIGDIYGVSRERIRQIEAKALLTLRENKKYKMVLKEFLN